MSQDFAGGSNREEWLVCSRSSSVSSYYTVVI